MMRAKRLALLAPLALAALAAACTPTLGPPAPGAIPPPSPGQPAFMPSEFAWSQVAGTNGIVGHVGYAAGATHYTCDGEIVVLTPETPWSKRRMEVLYLSSTEAALPTDQVRARMPVAPPGDSSPYIKRATCDAGDRFSFAHLPAGAWYVIVIGKPAHGPGPSLALMKRVVTRGGKITNVVL